MSTQIDWPAGGAEPEGGANGGGGAVDPRGGSPWRRLPLLSPPSLALLALRRLRRAVTVR
ncbi:hypothetical protein WMF20_41570 [Sorangium sp. So ce834]|uniref:hypothetical protein n=1 Tax=Sorangium sp. So ce834 TaxID=3133321 RepID=UPI003F5E6B24